MALMNVPPDYALFNGERSESCFRPLYIGILGYVMEKYAGQYWSALSREVAAFVETKNLVEKSPRWLR